MTWTNTVRSAEFRSQSGAGYGRADQTSPALLSRNFAFSAEMTRDSSWQPAPTLSCGGLNVDSEIANRVKL